MNKSLVKEKIEKVDSEYTSLEDKLAYLAYEIKYYADIECFNLVLLSAEVARNIKERELS